MEHHIDRRVVLNQDSGHKSLYDWSLQELDAEGNKIGRDQIPWGWTLYFTATELALSDTLGIKPSHPIKDDGEMDVSQRQFIRARLLPRDIWGRGRFRDTAYSMFGTDRTISAFELYIERLDGEDQQERCTAWGSISYTSEVDFFDETTDDTVIFYLHVNAETFARYAAKIAASEVDEATLRVSRVAGFYSEWSPAISTNKVKVLTSYDKDHAVEIPSGCEIVPPRLGAVGEAELTLRRAIGLKTTQDGAAGEEDEALLGARDSGMAVDSALQRAGIRSVRTASLLSQIRVAAWVIAGLLLLLLIK